MPGLIPYSNIKIDPINKIPLAAILKWKYPSNTQVEEIITMYTILDLPFSKGFSNGATVDDNWNGLVVRNGVKETTKYLYSDCFDKLD